MKFAFVMDPLEKVKAYKDTTYFLMLAAQERDHDVYYLNQRDLHFQSSEVIAQLTQLEVHATVDKPFTRHQAHLCPLSEMDVVFIRTDPPFDRAYLYATLLLDLLPASTRVINRPEALRNWNEKLSALFFPALIPATLITNEASRIHDFMMDIGRIALKPVDGHGGQGILFLDSNDKNADQMIQMITHQGSHWVIAQQYMSAAVEGDKRILLVNGEPLGGILRLHPEGKELNNLDAGGTAHSAELNQHDLEICEALKSPLLDQGVYFAGIDVIGGRLIEINVTSPTGLQELCRFSGKDFHHDIIAGLE
ncbi:MAG: glutathione synthase [Gammaproteobacteria bacterium]|nr:glutathione synthase [Gammaproteobacteria bacterium]